LCREVLIQRRQKAQLDHQLKSVADAQDQTAGGDEFEQLLDEHFVGAGNGGVEKPVGARLGRTQVVAVEETSRQVQEVIVVQSLLSAEQFADVDDVRHVRARQPAGVGHFPFAVRAVSRDDDGSHRFRHALNPLAER
jgi:hypothetical protein